MAAKDCAPLQRGGPGGVLPSVRRRGRSHGKKIRRGPLAESGRRIPVAEKLLNQRFPIVLQSDFHRRQPHVGGAGGYLSHGRGFGTPPESAWNRVRNPFFDFWTFPHQVARRAADDPWCNTSPFRGSDTPEALNQIWSTPSHPAPGEVQTRRSRRPRERLRRPFMNPLPRLLKPRGRARQQPCAFCSARRAGTAVNTGIEPTALERDAHDASCPLLQPRRRLKLLIPMGALALAPMFPARGCTADSGSSPNPNVGIDNGTVGCLDARNDAPEQA